MPSLPLLNKMNPEIKQRWLTTLLSSRFNQTNGALKDSKGYCCLGVLCEIQGASDDELYDMTSSVVQPKYAAGLSVELQHKFAQLNDAGMKFPEIARVIQVFA